MVQQSASSPNEIAASSHFQSPNKLINQYTSKPVNTLTVVHSVKESASVETNIDEGKTVMEKFVTEKTVSGKSTVFTYHQRPDETYDEYLDRVIDESLPDWEVDYSPP
jgi:hypothetical protein